MMPMKNDSFTSLGSNKDKELPPIPSPLQSPQSTSFDGTILQAKSLKRKNFKQLSLDSSSQKKSTDKELDLNFPQEPEKKVRPAPLLNLKSDSDKSPTLVNKFSKLELASDSRSGQNRVRQQVISSISPTTSSSVSPGELTKNCLEFGIQSESSPLSTTTSFKLNNNDLLTLKDLGSGNSGTVSKILHIPSQKTMAKKVIHIEPKSVVQTHLIRELKILHECKSPFIIEFYGAFLNCNNTIVICMEYCNCGSLDKILKLCVPQVFPIFALKKLVYSILSGLNYLYATHKIIHRDVKPSNVLMTHKGDFKLCDFGVSRELTNSLAMADTFVGTSTYMSPERIQGLKYGVKSDVWSMGLMLIELASGGPIWTDDEGPAGPEGILDLLQRIVNEPPPTLTKKINPITSAPFDPQLCSFIEKCLVKEEQARLSPLELLQHRFLEGVREGDYDRQVRKWAKDIRKLHKERSGDS